MARLDAYATDAEYRAAVGSKTSGTDATLNAQLIAASRLLERSLRVMPGAFNTHGSAQTPVEYTFDARGGTVLHLRDRAGMQYFLQTVEADGIGIDSEVDGTFDGYGLDFSDAWVRGLPENAGSADGEPLTAIELLAFLSTCVPTRWPDRIASVRITGTAWGWAAVPRIVKDLAIHLCHDLRDAQLAGDAGSIPTIDGGDLPLSQETWRFWRLAQGEYSHKIPVF